MARLFISTSEADALIEAAIRRELMNEMTYFWAACQLFLSSILGFSMTNEQ